MQERSDCRLAANADLATKQYAAVKASLYLLLASSSALKPPGKACETSPSKHCPHVLMELANVARVPVFVV